MKKKSKIGYFGEFGGRFAPETLIYALEELEENYNFLKNDPAFVRKLASLASDYAGRPTPLYFAERLSDSIGGAKIYLKREDLLHTGAHKINNVLGQILLAQKLGKKRVIAETGAGQHGVATASGAALFGMECVVYMGERDMQRQAPNVERMKLLGARVVPVSVGQKTLKEAVNEAMRDWTASSRNSHYVLGSALGPHPFPSIVRDFQSVIGCEARRQFLAREKALPNYIVACVGGGSNAIGIFSAFLEDNEVKLIGVEAGGVEISPGKHAARFAGGRKGILQGTLTWLLSDEDGQILPTHSISAGLDYAAVGPEHSHLHALGKAEYTHVSDDAALAAFRSLSRLEGIIPALESSHALSHAMDLAANLPKSKSILVNLSGRGDKDLAIVLERDKQ